MFVLPGSRPRRGGGLDDANLQGLPLAAPGLRIGLIWVGATYSPVAARDGPDPPPAASRAIDYATDVRPILETRCYACHGPKKQKADLRLDEKAAAFRGGSDGLEAIRPGHSAESELIRRVASRDPEERMPPEGEPLTPDQIGILRAWIDQGAKWPDDRRARWEGPGATGPSGRPSARPCRPSGPAAGLGTRSTASSSPGSRTRG